MHHDITPNPELTWYYQDADAALGERSSFCAMVARLQSGGGSTAGFPTVRWPDEGQCSAAVRQVQIRRALRQLPARLQAVIEAAYERRRVGDDPQLAATFGPLLVGVVLRAECLVGHGVPGTTGYRAAAALQRGLQALHAARRRAPDWRPMTPGTALQAILRDHGAQVDELRGGAEQLVLEAHGAYRAARGAPFRPEVRPQPVSRVLVPVGGSGARKRRLATPLPVARAHAA